MFLHAVCTPQSVSRSVNQSVQRHNSICTNHAHDPPFVMGLRRCAQGANLQIFVFNASCFPLLFGIDKSWMAVFEGRGPSATLCLFFSAAGQGLGSFLLDAIHSRAKSAGDMVGLLLPTTLPADQVRGRLASSFHPLALAFLGFAQQRAFAPTRNM